VSLDPTASPLAFFASEVKRLRANAGMTQEQLADATGYSPSTIAAIETCRLIPAAKFAELANKAFGTDGYLTGLQELVERTAVLPWFRDRMEVERKAIEIREYESYQIPGLLQTEDYARAVISSARPMLPEDAVERAVALRMTRQQILDRDDNLPVDQEHYPRLWAVMDEPPLHRVVGGAEIMQAQREHLAEMAQRPNVTIQIIPNSEGVTCAYGRAFTILTSASGPPVVHLEDIRDARYLRDRDKVANYMLVFDHLRACALNDKKSLKLIKGVES
jgi:transcriptional regulator with XRE-family HTH domain